jgi:long-chain acyl-CoA synthetase
MNFAQALRRSSRRDPSGPALLDGDRRVDYLALDMTARRIATILADQYGCSPGDRVAVLLPDTPELAFAAYGILWAGAVLCPLGPDAGPDALAEALTATGAKLLIGWHAHAEAVEQVGRALGIDWLLVEPREFSRLLTATPPLIPLADLPGDAPAILFERAELGHAALAFQAGEAAREMGLRPGVVLRAPASLSHPENQIRTLHAAVTAGAALRLTAATPLVTAREYSWR